MAETSLKRLREETEVEIEEKEEETKRHKSYNQILSLLDEADEEEPNEDLSSLITSLQQELSSEPNSNPNPEPVLLDSGSDDMVNFDLSSSSSVIFEDEEEKERVIRHLLEASDDELGIPQSEIRVNEEDYEGINGGGGIDFSLCDRLWELEDETANYYTLLQSELFM